MCKIKKISSDFWETQFPKMGKKLSFWPKTQFKMVKKPSFHPQNSVFSPKTQFKIAKTQFFRNFKSVDSVASAPQKSLYIPFSRVLLGLIVVEELFAHWL